MTRALITGIGAVTPYGKGVGPVLDALRSGTSAVGPIRGWDASEHRCRIGAEVLEFDSSDRVDPKEARHLDPYAVYALHAAGQALEDAGLDMAKVDPYRVACNVGSGVGGMWEQEGQFRVLHDKGPRRVSPYYIPKLIANIAAGAITIAHGIKGHSYAPVAACSTAGIAMGDALRLIRERRADVVVTGGAEAAITPIAVAGFSNMRALATAYNDDPQRASRPFDRDRCGFVMGEGAVIFVVESEEHAQARGAAPLMELAGYGATSDAYHITSPNPDGEAPARAMSLAIQDAQVPLEAIGYINAHGTSTKFNDATESAAIRAVFGSQTDTLPVSSTKSIHGHLLGAASAIEGLACMMALRDGVLPPTINLEHPDPECDLCHVANTPREERVGVALSNSFAFGGHNACLIFRAV